MSVDDASLAQALLEKGGTTGDELVDQSRQLGDRASLEDAPSMLLQLGEILVPSCRNRVRSSFGVDGRPSRGFSMELCEHLGDDAEVLQHRLAGFDK